MRGWQGCGAVRRTPRLLQVGTVLLTFALAGCGGAPASQAAPPSKLPGVGRVTTAPDGVQEVTIQTEDDYAFTPNRFTVQPGRVRLTVVNTARQLTHNFRFTPDKGAEAIPQDIALLAPGQRETITFTVHTPGSDPFECSFHTQLGQVGTMTVAGGK
jgi:plastocyanin